MFVFVAGIALYGTGAHSGASLPERALICALQFGFQIKSWAEIRGQILRLVFGGVKSFVGKIPVGYTGGANVLPLLPMEILEDLRKVLDGSIKEIPMEKKNYL